MVDAAFNNVPSVSSNSPGCRSPARSQLQNLINCPARKLRDIVRGGNGSSLNSKDGDGSDSAALDHLSTKKKKEKPEPRLDFSLWEFGAAVLVYLAFSVFLYHSSIEHWTVIDSLYFAITSFTTVGYGDLTPHGRFGKLCTGLFALGGVAFLTAALSAFGASLLQAEVQAMQGAQKAGGRRLMAVFEGMPHVLRKRKNGNHQENHRKDDDTSPNITEVKETQSTPTKTWKKALAASTIKYMAVLPVLFLGGSLIGRIEGWPWSDSIYYSIITASTVGFGDLSPQTQKARALAVLFVPLAVASMGQVLGGTVSYFLEKRREKYNRAMYEKSLSASDLEDMDADQSGGVSRNEYVEFMLIKMNLVDKEILDDLHGQFDRLDLDKNGSLSKRDLILMTKLQGDDA